MWIFEDCDTGSYALFDTKEAAEIFIKEFKKFCIEEEIDPDYYLSELGPNDINPATFDEWLGVH